MPKQGILAPEAEAALDARIESAIAKLRAGGTGIWPPDEDSGPDLVEAVEAEIAALIKRTTASDAQVLACPDCGQAYRPGDSFCASCGASLAEICPGCGAPHQPDDAYCARCGARLTEGAAKR